ncbi:head GIN domain-containing protein [Fluviicola sp.]|uniref:head GIN domain-containing protein n=1 Tax=Fluviicola sp. TaxID=1917219 RepID=UPI003D29B1B8
MKNLKWMIPVVLVLTVSITSCKKHLFNSIKGKGATVTETRNLSGFDKISLSINADITYTQDSVYFVEISAQQNVLDVITTEIEGGELKIDSRKWIRKHNGIKIIIHSPDLRKIDLDGSGNFDSTGMLTTTGLELEISGSGNIRITGLTAGNLDADISGSGNISISGGAVTNEETEISGSGDIEMDNLTANISKAKISGSGSISVWAVDQLNAKISGSGDIKYRGNPAVNTTISGSGSVIHI